MIENLPIDDLETFMKWYKSLSDEEIDMHEAMTIFFNQGTYLEHL